jgi:hypothetical protein
MAPATKAAALGKPIRTCAIMATAPVVASTRPTASSTIGLSCARKSSGEEEKAAVFKRGAGRRRRSPRGYLDARQAWHEAQPEAPQDQQDRVGHLKKASELGEDRRGGEQKDEGLALVHLRSHQLRLLRGCSRRPQGHAKGTPMTAPC